MNDSLKKTVGVQKKKYGLKFISDIALLNNIENCVEVPKTHTIENKKQMSLFESANI